MTFFEKIKAKKQLKSYYRCISSLCVGNDFHATYLLEYEFSFINNTIMGRKFLKKELKKWDIENATDLKNTIDWLITEGRREEYNQLRNELTPLSEKTRKQYIEGHPNYVKLYLANFGLKFLPHSGIAAYDAAWSIYLCRVGKALGLLSRREASEFMLRAAKLLQQSYESWNDFFNAFHLGSYFASIELV